MSPKTLLIAAAALAASATATIPVSAAPTGVPDQTQGRPIPLRAQIMFNLIDTNGDGALDQTEISALQKAIFAAIDVNKDGKLTQDEFKKVAEGLGGPGGPGRMGPGRFGHGPDGRWPGMHRGGPGDDRQGQLDDQQAPGPDGQMMMQGDNQDGPPPVGTGQPRDFASLDTNGDGVVSPDEFAAGVPDMPGIPPVAR